MQDVALQEASEVIPLFRIFLCGPFRVEYWYEDRWRAVPRSAWSSNNYARLLLKHMLCHPQRSVPRSILQRDLWPGIIPKESASYLNNAVSVVRVTLRPEGAETSLLLDVEEHTRYGLAGQELLWVDVDAALGLLHEAETIEQAGSDPLPLLEEAAALLQRGTFLEGEEHVWVRARRATVARAWRGCRLWQARLYQQREQWTPAQPLLDGLLEENPDDEDALCSLMQLLQARGRPSEALRLYEQLVERLAEQGKQPLETTRALAEHLRNISPPACLYLPSHASSSLVLVPKERPSLPVVTQGIIDASVSESGALIVSPSPEIDTLDIIQSRRQVLQNVLNAACAALTLSPYDLLHAEDIERIGKALVQPSRIQTDVIAHLSNITSVYWSLCANTSLDLLAGIYGHFATIIQLLKEPHPDIIYQQLCSLAGETAQILGKVLNDIREYTLAQKYYLFSIKAAKEAQNTTLLAAGMGRISELFFYAGQPQKALIFIQEARRIQLQNPQMGAWLAVIEAEIHAFLQNDNDSTRALDASKAIMATSLQSDDPYFTRFDLARQAGYEGVCFLRLHQPESALPALQKALDLASPTAIRYRSTVLTDIGAVHTRLGNVEIACSCVSQALDITIQTKSLSVLKRIQSVRRELEQWSGDTGVKDLDSKLAHTLASIVKAKEGL